MSTVGEKSSMFNVQCSMCVRFVRWRRVSNDK